MVKLVSLVVCVYMGHDSFLIGRVEEVLLSSEQSNDT